MAQWIPFEGTATDQGGSYRLAPSKGDGEVEFDKDAVRVSGDKVEVLVGATGRVTNNPTGTQPATMAASLTNNPDCPHGKTMCLGLVMLCCGSGKVLGPCIGIWGC